MSALQGGKTPAAQQRELFQKRGRCLPKNGTRPRETPLESWSLSSFADLSLRLLNRLGAALPYFNTLKVNYILPPHASLNMALLLPKIGTPRIIEGGGRHPGG